MTALSNVTAALDEWDRRHPDTRHIWGVGQKGHNPTDLRADEIRAALEEAWQLGAAYGVRHGHTAGGLRREP